MSYIRRFRVDGSDHGNSTAFYMKVERDDGLMICNYCVDGDGLYYYKAQSKILSPKENANTRGTYDGFISMDDLLELFEALRKAKIGEYSGTDLKITRQGKKVIIEEGDGGEG